MHQRLARSYKRLALYYDRTATSINALVRLAIVLICALRLTNS
jgi:hypothetical protein